MQSVQIKSSRRKIKIAKNIRGAKLNSPYKYNVGQKIIEFPNACCPNNELILFAQHVKVYPSFFLVVLRLFLADLVP